MNTEQTSHPFTQLDPDTIINAVESIGFISDQRILALNSYENRVYQVGLEDKEPVILKFYRPGRWTDAMIKEEHLFTQELANHEIPVLAPLTRDNETLFEYQHFRFAVYPRFGGYAPELDNPEHLLQLGRIMGRLHNIGAIKPFADKPVLNIDDFAIAPSRLLLEQRFIPADLEQSYTTTIDTIVQRIKQCYERAGTVNHLRLHGDCHHGNVLTRDDKFYLVDFDDARTGPAVQDIWMFLSGDRAYMTTGLHDLLEGYTEFRPFDARELHLVEALRSLRLIHYSAWLAQRWDDPAFPRAFPFFNSQRYWEDHILSLREQAALMDESPLSWQTN